MLPGSTSPRVRHNNILSFKDLLGVSQIETETVTENLVFLTVSQLPPGNGAMVPYVFFIRMHTHKACPGYHEP